MQTFCLLNCKLEKAGHVYEFISQMKTCIDIAMLQNGPYDIIAKFETEDAEAMSNLITWHVRKLDDVQSMQTLTCLELCEDDKS